LQSETYTELLWLLEGFTSYYDDLMLARSNVISTDTYLARIARTINNVKRGSGRSKQSIAESSFDAWIKFYRPDENTTNAQVNYYTKGSLVALALDLLIRTHSRGEKSLDNAMLLLWERYGHHNDALPYEKGFTEADAKNLLEEASGLDLSDFFKRYVHGTVELDLAPFLKHFGIAVENPIKKDTPSLNMRILRNGNDWQIANVYEGGGAHRAGLAAGDVLVAINDIRIPAENTSAALDQMLSRYAIGDDVNIHVFRRDELMMIKATLKEDDHPQYKLLISPEDDPSTRAARLLWLKPNSD
jgi:predicted metalloprotease with PDZ domain